MVLYRPRIPGNTGAIGRLCIATGSALTLVRPLFDVSGPRVRRAGLDYWPRLEPAVVDEVPAPPAGGRTVAFSARAATSIWEWEFGSGDLLLFGPEDEGLPADALAAADGRVRIPMVPGERSLNLAMAAAVGLYEAVRQVGEPGRR